MFPERKVRSRLRWDLGLFVQIIRSFRFPPEWDARYPGQNQTAADAPPAILLCLKISSHGNFRLPTTNFMAHILQFYGFHISQMSPPWMVQVRHLNSFVELMVLNLPWKGAAKKILLNPPKSFHDWKPKFFYIREEVIPIAMTFRAWSEPILKKDLPIPKHENWYQQLNPTQTVCLVRMFW
ncbi:hypothetical protein HanPSC8_Chr09g0388941 [Helianthus annuus]|nr:hypothetical protein HanPSC8_Chr09g0388941 [Helianthus annuus]